jgi:hypothetical protein
VARRRGRGRRSPRSPKRRDRAGANHVLVGNEVVAEAPSERRRWPWLAVAVRYILTFFAGGGLASWVTLYFNFFRESHALWVDVDGGCYCGRKGIKVCLLVVNKGTETEKVLPPSLWFTADEPAELGHEFKSTTLGSRRTSDWNHDGLVAPDGGSEEFSVGWDVDVGRIERDFGGVARFGLEFETRSKGVVRKRRAILGEVRTRNGMIETCSTADVRVDLLGDETFRGRQYAFAYMEGVIQGAQRSIPVRVDDSAPEERVAPCEHARCNQTEILRAACTDAGCSVVGFQEEK